MPTRARFACSGPPAYHFPIEHGEWGMRAWFWASAAMAAAFPGVAEAATELVDAASLAVNGIGGGGTDGLGAAMWAATQELGPIQIAISSLGIVLGWLVTAKGFIRLKEASDSPQVSRSDGFVKIWVGGALAALPSIAMVAMNALSIGGGELELAANGDWSSAEGVQGLATAAAKVATTQVPAFVLLAVMVSVATGLGLFLTGLMKLKEAGEHGQAKPSHAVARLAAASLLVALPSAALSSIRTFGWDGFAMAFGFGGSTAREAANGLGSALNVFQATQAAALSMLVVAASVAAGVAFVYAGVLKLKEAGEGDGRTKPSEGLSRLAGGAALLSLPSVVQAGLQSFGIQSGVWMEGGGTAIDVLEPGRMADCTAGGMQCAMAGFAANAAGPLTSASAAVAVLMGLILAAQAVSALARGAAGGSREPAGSHVAKLAVGVLLVNSFTLADGLLSSSFGLHGLGSSVSSLSSDATTCGSVLARFSEAGGGKMGEEQLKALLRLCFVALYPFGFIAAIRGVLMLKDHAEGNRQVGVGHAMTFMAGGTALMNAQSVALLTVQTLSPGSRMIETLEGMGGTLSC